jgi:glycosyltransferase involved in cell wall biosynthesis
MPVHYVNADLFLHPQTHAHDKRDFESFCIAIADAMAFGLPVIGGKDGAPADYIQHGVNGWLVDGNDVNAIANYIQEALTNDRLRRSMAEYARNFAKERFSWDAHVETLLGHRLPRVSG